MKLCPYCSSSLEEDAVKCRRCGKWVVGKRDREGPRRTRRWTKTRLTVLAGLLFLAWAVWAMPEGTMNPREILDLKPSPADAIEMMRSDLERLVVLQEEHYRTRGTYSGSPSALGFTSSKGVQVSLISTPTGWSAAATFEEQPPGLGCGAFGGTASPPRSPIRPSESGTVECTDGAG